MKVFWVFSGQGAQHVGMGADLYADNAAARRIFDAADQALDWPVSELCFKGPADKLTESRYCQPAIYTMSCAALEAFKSAYSEVAPLACAGLSLGEYAALFAGGAFNFEDGLRLVAQRGELMDAACRETDGGMASALGGDESLIKEICRSHDVDVANFNCPGQLVISGAKTNVEQAVSALKEKGLRKVIPLQVAGAYHSRLMSGAEQKLRLILDETRLRMPAVPVYHNYSAAPSESIEAIKENLAAQVAGSVRWEECVRKMIADGGNVMIEFGPGNVLAGLLRRIDSRVNGYNVNNVESLTALREIFA